MWQEYRSVILLGGALLLVYLFLFSCSFRGYGYLGHDGYTSGPSFIYMGGPSGYYPSRTVRGTGGRGGGPRSGK